MNRTVKDQDVKVGDVVRIEFGDFGNFVDCIITKEGSKNEHGHLKFVAKRCVDGVIFEFWSTGDGEMELIG